MKRIFQWLIVMLLNDTFGLFLHKTTSGESSITREHVKHNTAVHKVMLDTGIKPEELPPSEDIKKVGRRVQRDEKKIINKKNVK